VPFPSLRFLKEVEARTARRSRIREWVVLAVRAASLAVLALALSRPVLRGTSVSPGDSSRVFIIDNSLSMDARLDGVSALDRCLLVARGLVERMGGADRAAVIPLHGTSGSGNGSGPASDPVRAEVPPLAGKLTESRSDLQRALEQVRPTWRDSPLVPAVRQALELLRDENRLAREVYLFSDLQASALEAVTEPLGIPEGVALILLRPRVDARPNVQVASGEVFPGSLSGQARSTLRVRLRGSGGDSVCRLRFSVSGRPREERSVRVPDGGEAFALFDVSRLSPGLEILRTQTEDDVLPADNTLDLPYEVRARTRVLLVRDRARATGVRDPAYYVSRALMPRPRPESPLVVESCRTEELRGRDLASTEVIFLLEPGPLDPATGRALARFVLQGGGLLITAGSDPPRGAFATLVAEGAPLSPVRLGDRVRAARRPFRITAFDELHPVWAPLLATSPPLRPDRPAFTAYRRTVPDPETEVLAGFDSGDPALVLRLAGRGKVLFFAAPLTEAWGNLPLRYLFAPWIHSLVRFLAPDPLRAEQRVTGTRLLIRRPPESGLVEAACHPPGLAPRTSPATVEPSTGWLRCDLGVLERPGVYRVEEAYGDRKDPRVVSVRPPEAESDLSPPDDDRLQGLFPGARQIVFSSPGEGVSRVVQVTAPSELRNLLLWVLLGLLVLDPLLANRTAFRHAPTAPASPRRQEGRP
jgi:hypothetical protein